TYFTQSPDVALDMMRRLSQYVRSSNQALEVSVFDSPGTSKTTETPEKEESERTKLLTCAKDNQFIIDQFQAPADAFVKTRMPPIVHKTFWTIALMFCLFLAWSTLSVIDTTLSAPGKLTTVVPKIPVQAGSNGMVKSVQVTPGQEVKKGDVIATIDHTLVEADYNKIQKRNAHLKEKIKRLQLEISNAPLAEGKQLTSQAEQDIYELRWKEHNAKLKSFDIELHNIASALKTAQSNVNISEIELKENEHQYRKQKRLVDEKIVSSTALEEAQFRVDKTRARLKNSLASLDVAQKNYEAKMMDKKAYNNTRLKQLNDEHFAAIKQLEADTEELIKIDHQRTNTEIFSPVDGVVLEIEGLFVGAIVNVGEVVTTLVPTNVPLTVEMDINPKNIGNLSLGNEVSIKLSALPYQKHGDLSGKITFVSEDTVDTSITGQPGTFYRARADIISNNLKKLPKDFHLVPGMQINGDIRVGKRRVITYFLYPVIRTIETSFQEP
ncbi:MAG TPA: HlyD family type I secretion periplasmic adaptor subunit, partial [Gammaproteobacteria bacterium]|nr:HlyD family type I secretion periplasmic adaptor subunit [Gammaproteobacteria bacterium]